MTKTTPTPATSAPALTPTALPDDARLTCDEPITDEDITNLHQFTKVCIRAKLVNLTPEQHDLLRDWLEEESYTYQKVVELIRQHFGIVVGKSTVALYYRRHILVAHHDAEADAAAALLDRPIASISTATLNHARILAWTLLTRPTPQIDLAARLLEVIRRADQQAISRERLALEKERVALRREELASRAQPRRSPTGEGGPPRTPRAAPTEKRVSSPRPSRPQPPSTHTPDPSPTPPAPINPPLFPTSSTISAPSLPLDSLSQILPLTSLPALPDLDVPLASPTPFPPSPTPPSHTQATPPPSAASASSAVPPLSTPAPFKPPLTTPSSQASSPTSAIPLPSTPTPSSSFPSVQSVSAHSAPTSPAPAPNPPLFPTSSNLLSPLPPSPTPPSHTRATPPPSAPSASSAVDSVPATPRHPASGPRATPCTRPASGAPAWLSALAATL